jgi:hypothetical protein
MRISGEFYARTVLTLTEQRKVGTDMNREMLMLIDAILARENVMRFALGAVEFALGSATKQL